MRQLSYLSALGLGVAIALLAGGCSTPSDAVQSEPITETQASVPEPSAPSSTVLNLKSTSLTENYKNDSGYASSIKQTIWEPIPAGATSPALHPNGDATIDPSSDYDPKMDTVIPYSLTLTNTTKDFDIEQPRITHTVKAMGREVAPIKEQRTLEAWTWVEDSWSTDKWYVSGYGDAINGRWTMTVTNEDPMTGAPAAEWGQPLAPGSSVTVDGFILYRDTFTPAEPEGSKWVLDDIAIEVFADGQRTDAKPSTLSLTGKLIEKQ